MARTIQVIYDAIITEKETFSSLDTLVPNPDTSQTFLSDLNSTSKVAIWRLLCWLMAVAIWTHEKLFDQHTAEVEERAQELIPGTLRWYTDQSKLFQNGYDLTWDGDKYIYEDTTSTDAVAAQIVTQASATEVSGQVIIKVAKGDVGSLSALSAGEKVSFDSYVDQIKFAGTNTDIISETADILRVGYTITYDPLVLDSSGVLIADGVTLPVEVAIEGYIQALPFDNDFSVMNLTDAIQEASGVLNAVCTAANATYGAIPFPGEDILADPEQKYSPRAGYLDNDAAYPDITYISG